MPCTWQIPYFTNPKGWKQSWFQQDLNSECKQPEEIPRLLSNMLMILMSWCGGCPIPCKDKNYLEACHMCVDCVDMEFAL